MSDDFRLLMIGAMYENGGNVTHRSFDGHPELFVYPFESQLGTRFVNDGLTSMFPLKYRWPAFALHATPEEDYAAIIDEEAKVRVRTPHVSKFRDRPFEFSDDDRRARYVEHVARTGRSRGGNVAAFFRATFEAWKDFAASGRETVYVGYSPILVVDADKVVSDLPSAHFLHVVRNPWSAYADTKKRPLPMSLADYVRAWVVNQQQALVFQQLHPGRVHIVRTEDVFADPVAALGPVCNAVGIEVHAALERPTWNGQPMEEVYPWGTIRTPTTEANRATAAELSSTEQAEISVRAQPMVDILGYSDFLG